MTGTAALMLQMPLPPYAPFLCSSAAFSFFQLDDRNRFLDKRLAAVLLCAATIAAASMSKAVVVARAKAERPVREAANARKGAREALDRYVILSAADWKQASKEKPTGLNAKPE